MINKLVSVIIPTFNRINYLPITIDSVLNQTYSNYEIIVIDDGSTDDTGKVLREKYGNKIIYIWQENQGESVARNRGVAIAKGDYIAFLDSDDYWDSRKLEIQVNCFNRKDFDKVGCVFSSVWVVDELGKRIEENPKGRVRSKKDLTFESLLTKTIVFVPPSNVLLRSDCVRSIGGFDPSIQYGEDKDFLLRLRSKWDFYYIDMPLVYLRQHQSNQSISISEQKMSKIFSDRIKVVKKNSNIVNKINKKVVRDAINKILISAASWCFFYEKWADGIQYLLQVNNADHVIDRVLPERVAHIAYLKYLQQDDYLFDGFIDLFLQNIVERWSENLGTVPLDRIKGSFFQEFIFGKRKIGRFSYQYFLVMLIKHNPQLIDRKGVLTLVNLGK